MATHNISYNSKILEIMHRPTTKTNKYPLYTKVGSYDGNEERNTQAENDPEYQRMSQTVFNSPTNIRRLFITGKDITIHYYTKPHADGARKLSSPNYVGDSIFDIAEKMFKYNEQYATYLAEKTINKNAKEPDKYNITGNVVGIASSTYACNNLEEIYFDWTILLSQDVKPYFQVDDRTIYNLANGMAPGGLKVDDACLNFFKAFNLGGSKEIRKRFPRLRVIGIVSNLYNLFDTYRGNSYYLPTAVLDAGKIENYKTWYELNLDKIEKSNSACWVSFLTDIKIPNLEFIIKDNHFKFDAEDFKSWVNEHISAVKKAFSNKPNANNSQSQQKEEKENQQQEVVNTQIGEIENEFIRIKSAYGTNTLQKIIVASIAGMSKGEIVNVANTFTMANKKEFEQLTGISK